MALSLSRIHQLKTINNTCVRVCRCTGNVYPYRGERISERAAIPIKHSSQLTSRGRPLPEVKYKNILVRNFLWRSFRTEKTVQANCLSSAPVQGYSRSVLNWQELLTASSTLIWPKFTNDLEFQNVSFPHWVIGKWNDWLQPVEMTDRKQTACRGNQVHRLIILSQVEVISVDLKIIWLVI